MVDGLPESKAPLDDRKLRLFFEHDGDRLVRFVDLSANGESVAFQGFPYLLVERVQLVLGAVELRPGSI